MMSLGLEHYNRNRSFNIEVNDCRNCILILSGLSFEYMLVVIKSSSSQSVLKKPLPAGTRRPGPLNF
jgi:hypothetical protein